MNHVDVGVSVPGPLVAAASHCCPFGVCVVDVTRIFRTCCKFAFGCKMHGF